VEKKSGRTACDYSRVKRVSVRRTGSGTRSLGRPVTATGRGQRLRAGQRSEVSHLRRTPGLRKLPAHPPSATDQPSGPSESSPHPPLTPSGSELTSPAPTRKHTVRNTTLSVSTARWPRQSVLDCLGAEGTRGVDHDQYTPVIGTPTVRPSS
jgi:hypothetical protein